MNQIINENQFIVNQLSFRNNHKIEILFFMYLFIYLLIYLFI